MGPRAPRRHRDRGAPAPVRCRLAGRGLSIFLLATIACVAPGDFALDVEQSIDIGTVQTLRWQAPAAGETWVEVAEDGAWDRRQAVAEGVEEHVLVGLKPDRDVRLRVRVGDQLSKEVAVHTGAVPPFLPSMQVETLDDAAQPRPLLTGLGSNEAAAVIVDEDGDLPWWYLAESMQTVGRAVPTRDGTGVWLAPINVDIQEASQLLKVAWDGQLLDQLELPWMHHDFVELEDGTIAYLAFDPRQIGGIDVPGDRIMERTPDGSITEVFNAWGTLGDPDAEGGYSDRWPHANALDYLPDDDAYLVSLMDLDGIARVERATGELDWMLGGSLSTLADPQGSTGFFDAQHQHQWLGESLLVFVNGTGGQGESRVVEVEVDPSAGLAETVWEYQPGLESPVFGDVLREEDGRTRVTFSFAGEIHELSPEGELVWRLSSDLGGAMTYVTWLESLFEE